MTQQFNRRSARLKHYDYCEEGASFVTLRAENQKYLFGEIINSVEEGLRGTSKCIQENPLKWELDPENINGQMILPRTRGGL